jgi:hypothetical protein
VLLGIGTGQLPGLTGLPTIAGGRSSGARVAARTAAAAGSRGVLALGFPLCPPGRPAVTRIAELAGAGVPALVVQGTRDGFGGPDELRLALAQTPPVASVDVVAVPRADHNFRTRKSDGVSTSEVLATVTSAVTSWLSGLVPQA